MTIIQIFILALIQGAAELLPVSSSAHVIVTAKLMGLDPTTPEMTLLLVMLHTGTMFAVICYFWRSWQANFFASKKQFWDAGKRIMIATALTGGVGLSLNRAAVRQPGPDFGGLGCGRAADYPRRSPWETLGKLYQFGDQGIRADRHCPGFLPPVSRIFSFRGDHIHRTVAGDRP